MNKVSTATRITLVVGAIMLGISIFVPIWRIALDAPQYPEGLTIFIYADKLGGDIDIINGLNHYIGMQTLHTENFIEFTVLPYIFSCFALLMLISALVRRKGLFYFSFISFAIFGILAMVDFWRWEYNYGHNLDPKAAIIVPGMAYQPPLIGYKQLLNFGAFSIPDVGGWLIVATGIFLLAAFLFEIGALERFRKIKNTAIVVSGLSLLLQSCNSVGPDPIKLNKENCAFCQMTISDGRFAAELITEKGRIYKFDDLICMMHFSKENNHRTYKDKFVNDYNEVNTLIKVKDSYFIHSINIRSPMGGNIAAFANKDLAENFTLDWHTKVFSWEHLNHYVE
jgi:copper chaperone NosL